MFNVVKIRNRGKFNGNFNRSQGDLSTLLTVIVNVIDMVVEIWTRIGPSLRVGVTSNWKSVTITLGSDVYLCNYAFT